MLKQLLKQTAEQRKLLETKRDLTHKKSSLSGGHSHPECPPATQQTLKIQDAKPTELKEKWTMPAGDLNASLCRDGTTKKKHQQRHSATPPSTNRAANTRRKLRTTADAAFPGTRGSFTDTCPQNIHQDSPYPGHKTNLNKFTRAETIQGTFSDHHGVTEIKDRKLMGKSPNSWKL